MISRFTQNIPVRRKVTLVILLACLATLGLVAGSLFVFHLVQSRRQITQDLVTQAEIIAANSTAAISFQDREAATEMLRSLKAKPHILGARLFLPDGTLLARYGTDETTAVPPGPARLDEVQMDGPHLVLYQSVWLGNRGIGILYLRFDFRASQNEMLLPYLGILSGIVAATALMALVVSTALQRVISTPILRLTATARAVADQQDYSVRAQIAGRDEIGTLTSAFNNMLSRIQAQDTALRESEARYRLLFEDNPLPLFVYDTETFRYLAVNGAAIAHYGYTREEFLSMTAKDLRPPEDVPALLSRSEGKQEPETYSREWRHRKKDGTLIEVETTVHHIEFLGRKARLVLAVDITQRKQAEAALQQRYRIEALVGEISTQFINLPPAAIDASIQQTCASVGQFANADRACLFQLSEDGHLARCTHEWSATSIPPLGPTGQNLVPAGLPWLMEQLSRLEPVHISEISGLPPEASAERNLFAAIGVQSLLLSPMVFGGDLRGCLTFSSTRRQRSWSNADVTLLQMTAQILANALDRKRAHESLESLHDQMLTVSRQAGMAEVAVGVLHNVGNVLNSVNVSANLVADRLRNSRVGNVAKLAELLRQHEQNLPNYFLNDPRGKQIPGYLQELAQHLRDEQKSIMDELAHLTLNVEHIKQIVAMQQGYARVSGVEEVVPVDQLVEDALRLAKSGFARHGVTVTRQFEATPAVSVDKHKVMQILINLLRNARQALETCDHDAKGVWVRIQARDQERVTIQVRDNGVGIEPANLTRVFSYGFTTKRAGHGFGLHQSALAAKELGGTLTGASEGLGRGATFTLALPIARPDENHDLAITPPDTDSSTSPAV